MTLRPARRQESRCFLLMTPRWRSPLPPRWSTPTATDRDGEELPDVAALDEFVADLGLDRRTAAATRPSCDAVRALRPRLRRIWEVDEDEVVEIVNGLLREARALPQLVKHDEWNYHLHATPPDAPLATRMAVEAAMAMVDVVRSDELGRLRICDSPRLRQRRRRPVQEPVQAVLRRRLRQPRRGRRLPRPQVPGTAVPVVPVTPDDAVHAGRRAPKTASVEPRHRASQHRSTYPGHAPISPGRVPRPRRPRPRPAPQHRPTDPGHAPIRPRPGPSTRRPPTPDPAQRRNTGPLTPATRQSAQAGSSTPSAPTPTPTPPSAATPAYLPRPRANQPRPGPSTPSAPTPTPPSAATPAYLPRRRANQPRPTPWSAVIHNCPRVMHI